MTGGLRRVSATVLLLVALGTTGVVYYPVTRTYFFADDFVCQLRIVEWRLVHFLMAPFGGHILLVRNLVFYLWYVAFGLWPEPYHWAAFVTHLINVWLLFRVIRVLTGDLPLACLGSAAWGTSPLGVGTLGWYSVYGHVLVATVLLVILGDLTRRGTPSFLRAAGWCLLLIAGTTCFGVGIGVALVFPFSLFLLAPEAFHDFRLRTLMLALPFAVVALYFAYRRLSTLIAPLSLSELIVVQLGVSRPGPILEMAVHLLGSAIAGLVFGFHFSTTDYPSAQADHRSGANTAGPR